MTDLLAVLTSALRGGPDPLCIDVDDRSAEGQLRSSNGAYMRRLPRENVEAMARLVKEMAHLDASMPRRTQSGKFKVLDEEFTVNCCPQINGEILVVHHHAPAILPRR